MVLPTLDVRINWNTQDTRLSKLDNDGFETNTTGWSVAAGIQSAATSITRTTGDHYMGAACGQLVTTATSGSGVKNVLSFTFTQGLPYRFRVWLKSVSGTTSAKILIGSLGTPADRASSSITLTGSWAAYSVDWTPTGNRSDVQINITNNAAAIMTANIDDAEVYLALDDVTGDAQALALDHGANFEGGLLSGNLTLTLKNDAKQFTQDPTYGQRIPLVGMQVYARLAYGGVPYGLFYGTIKRVTLDYPMRTVQLFVADPVDGWSHAAEINIATSTSLSVAGFRGAILDAIGEPSTRRSLSSAEEEASIPVTGADAGDALTLLSELDVSTGTVGFLAFDPSPSVLFRYTTIPRNAASAQSSDETFTDEFTDVTWEHNEQTQVSAQRVDYTLRATDPAAGTAVSWDAPDLPFSVPASSTVTLWVNFSDPISPGSGVLSYDATNAPTVSATFFARSAKIDITTGGSDSDFDLLHIDAVSLPGTAETAYKSFSTSLPITASPITAPYVSSTAEAQALAYWWAGRYNGTEQPRLELAMEGNFPTQVQRNVMDLVTVGLAWVRTATYPCLIRSIHHEVDFSASRWTTTYSLEQASPLVIGAAVPLLTFDTSTFNNGDHLGF